ncbi:outer membrane protein YtfM [Candidatus Pantoea carbekii]|uniref:Uncharacterized protein n=2 Tax=Candidatus Pantoea carbekii TaxID=1235990 RepID=U3U5W2_9GAMM|nr:outer membrane protein YtfM [Candidatus Pantoea carbekii]BAO00260.1 hypothetical protein HHS_02900 [Candidatus Pantoea carbekii]
MLVIHIISGQPIRIAGSKIIIKGEASTNFDYQMLVKKSRPKIGSNLNHIDYETFKHNLYILSQRNGYFDGYFKKNRLCVFVKEHKAFWDIDYDSGSRYNFGYVNFKGSQIKEMYLKNLMPFKRGDPYRSQILAEINHRLSLTDWFNSIIIEPKFDKNSQTKILSLNAFVSPRLKNIIEIGIGYSTDTGLYLKGTWKKPWVNNNGHCLTYSIYRCLLGTTINLHYKVPLLKNPIEQYYDFSSTVKYTIFNIMRSDSKILAVSRCWYNPIGWKKSINLRWSVDSFIEDNIYRSTMLLCPIFSLNHAFSCCGLMPQWGHSQIYWMEISNTSWGSDVDFLILQAQNVWIRTLNEKNRFLIRTHLGWIKTKHFNKVPPNLRFFIGSDHSIRGYKCKSIAQNATEKLIGASKIITNSLEYQYNFTNKCWSAIFIDAGEVVNDIMQSNVKIGIGLGVRWLSPLGTMKFDISSPLTNVKKHDFQFYIALGPEL